MKGEKKKFGRTQTRPGDFSELQGERGNSKRLHIERGGKKSPTKAKIKSDSSATLKTEGHCAQETAFGETAFGAANHQSREQN